MSYVDHPRGAEGRAPRPSRSSARRPGACWAPGALSALCMIALATPARAEEAPRSALPGAAPKVAPDEAAPDEAAPAGGAATRDRASMIARSAEVARGYYQALQRGDFAGAAGFLHPAFLRRLHEVSLEELERLPEAEARARAQGYAAASVPGVRALSPAAFFVRFVQSPQGAGLRALSDPALGGVRAVVEHSHCVPERAECEVTLRLKGTREDGQPFSAPQRIYVWFDAEGARVEDRPRP